MIRLLMPTYTYEEEDTYEHVAMIRLLMPTYTYEEDDTYEHVAMIRPLMPTYTYERVSCADTYKRLICILLLICHEPCAIRSIVHLLARVMTYEEEDTYEHVT